MNSLKSKGASGPVGAQGAQRDATPGLSTGGGVSRYSFADPIVQSPQLAPRVLIYVLALLVAGAVLGAFHVSADIVVRARGTVGALAPAEVVSSPVEGVIEALMASRGMEAKKGAPLFLVGLGMGQGAESRTVRSPRDGMIQRIFAREPGQRVERGTPLCTLLPRDVPLCVEFTVPEAEGVRIKPGNRVRYKLDAFPHLGPGMAGGKVLDVSAGPVEGSGGRRLYRVLADLEKDVIREGEESFPIRPGMGVTVFLPTGRMRWSALLTRNPLQ